MVNYNYRSIVERLIDHHSEKANDWESGFLDTCFNWEGDYTDPQKETILKLNRKYVVSRRS